MKETYEHIILLKDILLRLKNFNISDEEYIYINRSSEVAVIFNASTEQIYFYKPIINLNYKFNLTQSRTNDKYAKVKVIDLIDLINELITLIHNE